MLIADAIVSATSVAAIVLMMGSYIMFSPGCTNGNTGSDFGKYI